MKSFILLALALCVVQGAYGGVSEFTHHTYRCSDGVDYTVLHFYSGPGGDSGAWNVQRMCNLGIVKDRTIHPLWETKKTSQITACEEQDTPQLKKCFAEFQSLNITKGKPSERFVIKHGRPVQQPSYLDDSETNYNVRAPGDAVR